MCCAAAAALGLLLTGCAQAGSGSSPATTPPSPTSSAASEASACADITSAGGALGTALAGFAGGTATGAQVGAAATDLSNALRAAPAAVRQSAGYNQIQTAVANLKSAAQARPVDATAIRTAGTGALAALRQLPSVCGSSSTASTPPS